MPVIPHILDVKGSSIRFLQIGNGVMPMIAIHGFADSGELFEVLEKEQYTIYALDLPYHGESQWSFCGYTVDDVILMIEILAKKEQFEQFMLLGFSLGGRVAMGIIRAFRARLTAVTLVAPDGIYSKWFWLEDMFPTFLKRMAIPFLRLPSFIRFLARILRKLGLSEFSYKFILFHTATPERRRRVICSWVSMKSFPIEKDKIGDELAAMGMPIRFFVGKNDRIILPEKIAAFAKSIPNAQFQVLEGGHRSVMPALAEVV